MAHITSCIRRSFEKVDAQTDTMEQTSSPISNATAMHSEAPITPERRSSRQPCQSPPRYQLWPRVAPKHPEQQHPATFGTFLITSDKDKDIALQAGRSPTSLSENSGKAEIEKSPAFWPRQESSLSRRRKISVPELNTQTKLSSSPSEDEFSMDSPTIPGRPALRKMPSMDVMHSRSSSAPNHWRNSTLDDSLAIRVTSPPRTKKSLPTLKAPWTSSQPNSTLPSTTYNPTRPLSPILSPPLSAVPSMSKDTPATPLTAIPIDIPPKVPPKTQFIDATPLPPKTPPKNGLALKTSPISLLRKSTSKSSLRSVHTPSPTGLGPAFNTPPPRSTSRMSPNKELPQPTWHTNASRESVIDLSNFANAKPMIERGRPIKRQTKSPPLSPSVEDTEALPKGLKPMEATLILPETEREVLRRQAVGQTEKFEVLASKHVESLSQELRTLDERCDYLRKTYKSLRAGRQKLHSRMLSYLRSESISFSREQLLKQEIALVELDNSIDDWFRKLERAENRRLRIRQKLLEHVAAAMALSPSFPAPPTRTAPSTPPAEMEINVQSPTPVRTPRHEVESIKVYADNQVLNLFTDIEHAVKQMCEAC